MRRPAISDVLLLVCLASIWGGSFPAVKIAVAHMSDTALVALRLAVGAAAMGAVAYYAGKRPPGDRRTWTLYLAAAMVGNVLPFLLISEGQRHINAGLAAILMATMPLATLVLAHFFTSDEKLTARRLAGVTIGLAGVLVLVGVDALKGLGADVLGQLALTAAAMCYALHLIVARRLHHAAPVTNAACSIGVAALIAFPLMLAVGGPPAAMPIEAALAVLFLGVGANGIAYLLFFRLVTTVGVTFTATINYLVPIVGVLWSALLLGERPNPRALAALALILAGIAVANLNLGRRA
ncbi:MAG: DMT family transporter, partial [Rhodospirillales bacterium]